MHSSHAAHIAQRHHATLASCSLHVTVMARRSLSTAPPLGNLSRWRGSPCSSAKPLRMSVALSRCMKVMVRELLEATATCKGREGRARSPGEVDSFGARACSALTCCLWSIWCPARRMLLPRVLVLGEPLPLPIHDVLDDLKGRADDRVSIAHLSPWKAGASGITHHAANYELRSSVCAAVAKEMITLARPAAAAQQLPLPAPAARLCRERKRREERGDWRWPPARRESTARLAPCLRVRLFLPRTPLLVWELGFTPGYGE